VVKHSGVQSAGIVFSSVEDHLVLIVRDQDVGFCPNMTNAPMQNRGLGLIRLQERIRTMGGDFFITSSPVMDAGIP
jgi:signal transduction histidine kinase